jgi:DhnA family fructose-bisphosphate aldolase class Ia
MSVAPRLNRLLGTDGKCFDVAIDHGFFNERSFLGGIEDVRRAVRTVVEAGPDAVEQAVRLDAACVVVNLLLLPGQPELHRECVENVSRLKAACEPAGMPLMVEPLVMQGNEKGGGYMVDGDIDKILPLVRQAVELGADVVKADPTEDVREYHRVIAVAGDVPVLVRGGGRAPDVEILARTEEVMRQGAKGIVYGRNVIAHEDPAGMVRALMAIVHDGADAGAALEILRG